MTLSAPEQAVPSLSTSPTARSIWRGGRGFLVFGVLVVAVAVLTVLITGTSAEGRDLDPAGTSLNGGKALAEILRGRGVRVERVSTVADVERLDGAGAQLLLTDTTHLSEDDLRRLAATRADRLVVGPSVDQSLLPPGLQAEQTAASRSREPMCDLPAAVRAGSAHTGGVSYRPPRGAVGCYPDGKGFTLVRQTTGSVVTTVVGDGAFMSNQRLAEDGNAALAMNLAGARPVLIWFVAPDRPQARPGSGRATLGELIPPGVPWAVLQLGVALLVVALWRARRLGPVVVERLPVVVRAAETVEGRGRLYRARRARDRASATLRAACVSRIAPRLGLSGDATWDEVVAATALRTGQDAVWVRSVLYGPIPADDAGLVALAGHLDTLERQVREP
ncbi:DUF4350 domain-containing protein [Sphaerisporangium fuscum]|uniref:DUF4350 domain-containing protein n=1 Tax=Sphaerisporangium fuscum TaxID=2835868 RepID=UPI0027E2C7B7|nr:DUF4350 domain-containing protein [Sphaerisporangium fuscum]